MESIEYFKLIEEHGCMFFEMKDGNTIGHYYETPDGKKGKDFDAYFENNNIIHPVFNGTLKNYEKLLILRTPDRHCECCQDLKL